MDKPDRCAVCGSRYSSRDEYAYDRLSEREGLTIPVNDKDTDWCLVDYEDGDTFFVYYHSDKYPANL